MAINQKPDKTEVVSINIQLTSDQYTYLQYLVDHKIYSSKVDLIRHLLREYMKNNPIPPSQ